MTTGLTLGLGGGGHVVSLNTKPPRSRQGEGDKVESLKGNFRFHITWVLLWSIIPIGHDNIVLTESDC